MIAEIPSLIKISSVVVGGVVIASASSFGELESFSKIGGWGLAVVGLITFWRQAQRDREKFDLTLMEEREKFMDDLNRERERMDKVHQESWDQAKMWRDSIEKLTHSIQRVLIEMGNARSNNSSG